MRVLRTIFQSLLPRHRSIVAVALIALGTQSAFAVTFSSCIDIGPQDEGESYLLTAPISATTSCIGVHASNVTIDLGGHTITRSPTISGSIAVHGILMGAGVHHVTIKNGTLANLGTGRGIAGSRSSHTTISSVTITGVSTAVDLGPYTRINNSVVRDNRAGILVGGGSSIVNSVIESNGIFGIQCARYGQGDGASRVGCTIENNIVFSSGGPAPKGGGYTASHAIEAQIEGSRIIGNLVTHSGGSGIYTRRGGHVVEDNTVRFSVGNGINLSGEDSGHVVRDNSVMRNFDKGIEMGCPSIATGNISKGNSAANIQLNGSGCETGAVANLQ